MIKFVSTYLLPERERGREPEEYGFVEAICPHCGAKGWDIPKNAEYLGALRPKRPCPYAPYAQQYRLGGYIVTIYHPDSRTEGTPPRCRHSEAILFAEDDC